LSEQTEYELLELARAGHEDAFEQLQMALESRVRRFIRRLIGRSDVEDDITQNAFFALYKNLNRLDEGAKLRPFVFRVVRNQCYDELRRQGRYDVVSLDDDVSGYSDEDGGWSVAVASEAPQPDEATYWMMVFSEVQEAIQQLPELQRQTLLLYTEANLSYVEIADAMAVNIGTVKSRLHHAKRGLVRRLSPETRIALGVGDDQEQVALSEV
jgi:RNA polymerase sigma-70 factor, ECF subfamily